MSSVVSVLRCMSSMTMSSGRSALFSSRRRRQRPQLFLLQPGGIDGLEGLLRGPDERAHPGHDVLITGRAQLTQHLGGHPRAAHRPVGRVRRPYQGALWLRPAGQLPNQARLARAGLAAQQRHLGLTVPVHPPPQRLQIGQVLLPPEQRHGVAGLTGIGRAQGHGLPDLHRLPLALRG